MQFEKGQSGNPSGRPKGAKDRRTIFRDMIDPHKKKLVNKAVEMALAGDQQMLRLLLDRVLPPKPKDESATIILADDTPTNMSKQVINYLNEEELTPSQALDIMRAIAFQAKIFEADEAKEMIHKIKEVLKEKNIPIN